MERISKEDGINAGARNIGRFFLAMIPWALSVGAMAWLGTWITFHEWQREARQAQRAAVYVAAPEPLKNKMKVTVLKRSCVIVEWADVDGPSLTMDAYAPSGCDSYSGQGYAEWHWQQMSPNGTILHQGYSNAADIHGGEWVEYTFSGLYGGLSTDDRVAEVQVWVSR